MEAILDSSFIISCLRLGIDFHGQLEELGFKVVLPKEVFQELKDIRARSGIAHIDKEAIDVAFVMFEQNKIKKMSLGKGKVDDGLVRKGKEGVYIASLDKGILREIKNKIVIKSSEKRVAIERD
jgi:rRNA-processing protein FCF1